MPAWLIMLFYEGLHHMLQINLHSLWLDRHFKVNLIGVILNVT